MTPRHRALEILRAIDAGQRWSYGSGGRDDAFIRTLVQGVLRWRLTIDHLIRELSGRDIDRIDPVVLEILRLGVYQIHWMRTADHAAVNESVEMAKRVAPRAKNFVNAVLRNATRRDLAAMIPGGTGLGDLAIRLSHPRWLLDRWTSSYGADRTGAIAAANQELSHPDLLLDPDRVSTEEVQQRLAEEGITSMPSPLVPGMLRVLGSTSSLADWIRSGAVWPMDEGSAIVAMLAGSGHRVLDLAAAPGGKSLIMQRAGNRVISHDVAFERLRPLRQITSHPVVVGDGRMPPFGRTFDVVVLDAPCSASGIIRKHPEIKWRLTPELVARSAELQRALIESALDLSHGRLVYATCSMEREENDEVVQSLLASHPGLELVDPREMLPEILHTSVTRGVLRLSPELGTDGFTAFVIQRRDEDHANRRKPA